MGRIEKSIEIKAPPEKVWEMLAWDRFPEWYECKSAKYTSDVQSFEDKYKVGASAHMIDSHNDQLDFVITQSLKNERIVARSKGSGIEGGVFTFAMKTTETGTEITFVVEYEMPGGFLGKILDKSLFEKSGQGHAERSLSKLKSILEK